MFYGVHTNAGRTIRVHVEDQSRVSEFLTNAVQAAFDWVSYNSTDYVRLSVIPDSEFNHFSFISLFSWWGGFLVFLIHRFAYFS